jgi:hypothetical protein
MVDPVNRDRRSGRSGRLRSRMTISTTMPTRPSAPIHSVTSPYGVQPPSSGRWPAPSTTSKYASSTSSESTTKATMTNQWAAPTTLHRSMRVCPTVSASITRSRVGRSPPRAGSGWPSRISPTMRSTARIASTAATAVTATASTVVTT